MTDTPPPFEVSLDPHARLLRWTMGGFWSLSDVAAFGGAMRAAVKPLGPPPQRFDGLCDSRDFPVQSIAVSTALGAIDRIGAAMRRGRVAIVVGSVMNKLQAERSLKGGALRVFLSIEEAEAWLQDKTMDPS